jgi:NAD-dependent dihydropyrimidine dehydrogenase PreA subunit
MAYVIAEPCIDNKDASCVEVCPVDAVFSGDQLPAKWDGFATDAIEFFRCSYVKKLRERESKRSGCRGL